MLEIDGSKIHADLRISNGPARDVPAPRFQGIEQSFKCAATGDTTNKMKRDIATKFILEHAAKRGVKIDPATAESLVEIAVYRLKYEKQHENQIEK